MAVRPVTLSILVGSALVSLCSVAQAARYGLMVGIDNYVSISSLSSCVNDARGVRQGLLSDSSRWSAGGITTLTDSAATEAAIRSRLNTLASSAVAGDVVVYFHSSHGGQHSGADTFLCTYDSSPGYYEDYELAGDLTQFADGVTVLIMVDACNSGGLFLKDGEGGEGSSQWNFGQNVMDRFHELKAKNASGNAAAGKGAGIGWITACRYYETCLAGTPYSLFARHLIYGLSFGDADRNGTVTFQELFDYAAPKALLRNPSQHAQSLNTGVLTGTVAARVVAGNLSLQNAIDAPSLSVLTGPPGDEWNRQTGSTHDGSDSARSADVSDNESSEFVAQVVGPGGLTFWWCVSSEADYDWAQFSIDGVGKTAISGERSWEQKSFRIGAGTHTVAWLYAKDSSRTVGWDRALVDQVVWTPDAIITTTSTTTTLRPLSFARIGNKSVVAGQLLQFDVRVHDPDSAIPVVSMPAGPAGAQFVDNGDATGTFNWEPSDDRVGRYVASFVASTNGYPTDTVSINVSVSSHGVPWNDVLLGLERQ